MEVIDGEDVMFVVIDVCVLSGDCGRGGDDVGEVDV